MRRATASGARLHGTVVESPMDHDTLLLAAELFALFALGGVGLWRVYRGQQMSEDESHAPAYDMRRDGQRLTSQ